PSIPGDDAFGEVFEVYLVADTHSGRNHGEVGERLLAPLKQLVPLSISFILKFYIALVGVVCTDIVYLNGMIDDQVDRNSRIDFASVAALPDHFRAYGGDIDNGRYAREILHQYAGWFKGDLLIGTGWVPVNQGV